MSIGSEFLQSVINRVNYYKALGDKTFAQLEEFEFHFQPNAGSNSIALIIQHMAGNMLSRWTDFLDLDGEKDWRNRDTEFEEQQLSGNQLIALWEKGWACFTSALSGLTENDLLKTIYIRQEALLVVDAINRQLAHYPYHVGQIIYTAKIIKDKQWTNLSIPRGGSAQFNDQLKKQ
jgi:hypothetical protein